MHLRALASDDFAAWKEVRTRCRDWLVRWEPRPAGAPYPAEDRASFIARCAMRGRELQLGTGYGFGIFVGDRFAGEVNLSSVQRGAFQSGYVGYWIDEALAGNGYVAGVLCGPLPLRLRAAPSPPPPGGDRAPQRPEQAGGPQARVAGEGIALRYLEIDGRWEDHVRYALTAEEWLERREGYTSSWLGEVTGARPAP